jgi:thiamine pyrophosphate-dependent acetolactate synthase large subunit-like protein
MDFGKVVMASGWAGAREVWSQGDLKDALQWAKTAEGPLLIRVYTTTEQIPTDYFLEDPAVLAEDFRRWLRQSSAT